MIEQVFDTIESNYLCMSREDTARANIFLLFLRRTRGLDSGVQFKSHTMEGWRQPPVALYRRGAGSPPHHHPSTYPLPPTLHRECIQRLTMHSFQPHASLALTTPFSTTLGHALGPRTGAAHGDRALLNPKPLRGPDERVELSCPGFRCEPES